MEILRNLRVEKGYTQLRMAELLGIQRPTYSRYETGERQPDHATLIKLAEILNISIDRLLGKTDFSVEENYIICENISKLMETQKNPPNPDNIVGIDLTFGSIQKYEYQFTRESLAQFASYFDVTIDYLLRRNEKNPAPSLTASELQLINNFRSLNGEGQEKLLDHSIDLVSSGRYIKSNESEMVSKNA